MLRAGIDLLLGFIQLINEYLRLVKNAKFAAKLKSVRLQTS